MNLEQISATSAHKYIAMRNLEVKVRIGNKAMDITKARIDDWFHETLHQTDTYYHTSDGERLKLREIEEVPSETHMIKYKRIDSTEAMMSTYDFYPIPDIKLFHRVFDASLQKEVTVKKRRDVYIYKNARIHFDRIPELGSFVEIEIVINNYEDEVESMDLMDEMLSVLGLMDADRIDVGYRELLLKKSQHRDLDYYASQDKIFWVVNKDINDEIRANDIVPCIFVERRNDKTMGILQLDWDIKLDDYKYTAWRRLIGDIYAIYVDVLLIKNKKLYRLSGEMVDFDQLDRSDVTVDKKYLAKFSVTNPIRK